MSIVPESPEQSPLDRLSAIDRQILRLVAQGRSSKEIGRELNRSPLTIDSRLKDVCARLGADNRVQAASMLLLEEAHTTTPDLGGTQIRRLASRPSKPWIVSEDDRPLARGSRSLLPRLGDLRLAMGPVEAGEERSVRSLIQVTRTVLILLAALAAVAFFLASAIEAVQGVFLSVLRG